MNSFNEFYNLILQSIISQNRQYRKQVLANSKLSIKRQNQLIDYLNMIDNKVADFLVRYFADETLISPLDERVRDVKTILRLQSSIDTQKWNGTLDQFLEKYDTKIQEKKQKELYNNIQFIDKLSVFSQKKEYTNGIVIYRVEDSKQALQTVRKIVDMQLGVKTNPWCLITNKEGENPWHYWNKVYIGYPKHIAFKNGKVFAFCAGNNEQNEWWDLKDKNYPNLPLGNGKFMEVEKYKWSNEEKVQRFLSTHPKLKLNPQTGRYDAKGFSHDIFVDDKDLVDGHFPIPFGYVGGSFICDYCNNLTSLENGPIDVGYYFDCGNCINLKNLKGAPDYVGAGFKADGCLNLESLQGAPRKIDSYLDLRECEKLQSLKGLNEVDGQIRIFGCDKLKLTPEDQKKYWFSRRPNVQ